MTEQLDHLPTQPAIIIGYILFVVTLLAIIYLGFKNGQKWITDLTGSKLEPSEAATIIWLHLFPSAVLADIFLGFHASDIVWYSMDAIMMTALGGTVYKQVKTNKQEQNEKDPD